MGLLVHASLWIGNRPEVMNLEADAQQENDQKTGADGGMVAEQKTRAAEHQQDARAQYGEFRRRSAFRLRVARHHVCVLEVIEPSHQKISAHNDAPDQEEDLQNLEQVHRDLLVVVAE